MGQLQQQARLQLLQGLNGYLHLSHLKVLPHKDLLLFQEYIFRILL